MKKARNTILKGSQILLGSVGILGGILYIFDAIGAKKN